MPYCGQLQRRLPETGAALAYYSVFSLGPIIVIAIAVAGFFFGRDAVSGQVASSTKDMLGGHRCTSHSSHVSGCRSAQRVQNRDSAPASERRRAAPGPPFFYRHSISSRIVRSRGSTKYVLLSRSIYRYSRSVGDSRWTSSGKDRISTESGNRSPTRTRVEAALLPVVRCSVRGCSARERACLRMTSRSLSEKVVLRDAGAAAVDCDAGAAALDRPARGSTSTIL